MIQQGKSSKILDQLYGDTGRFGQILAPYMRTTRAALIYAGNITSNEGSKLLLRQGKVEAANVLLNKISGNHYYQQRVVETLWTKVPKSFEGLFRHIDLCKKSVPRSWKNLQELAKNLEKFAESIRQ